MSRKQALLTLGLFLSVLLFGLFVNLPARHVLQFVELPAEIKIQGLQGSIKAGRVQLLSYQKFHLTDVNFEIQPLCLLTASLCYQLQSVDKDLLVNFELNLFSQNIRLTKSKIVLDSEVFKDIPQLLAQPKGLLAIELETLTMADSKISELVAKVDWIGAGLQGEDQLLGNYNALVVKQADGLNIELGDQDSLLSLSGDLDVKWSGLYDVDLKFETRPTLNKPVISVLEMTTKKSGLNRFSLKRSGNVSKTGLKYLALFKINE